MKKIVSLLACLNAVYCFAQVSHYSELQRSLGTGWNTWSYNSMLEYVLLPQNLSLKINLRQSFIATPGDAQILLDQAIPDSAGLFKPIAHTWDGGYTELLINNWKGNSLRVQSTSSEKDLIILITPAEISDVQYQIEVPVGFLWNSDGRVFSQENKIMAIKDKDTVTIRATSEPFDAYYAYQTPSLTFSGKDTLAIYTGGVRSLEKLKAEVQKAKQGYLTYSKKYDGFEDGFRAIQNVLAWNTIYDPSKKRVISPVSRAWNEAWQGHVLFNWDTYLAAWLFALDNKELAYSNAIAVTAYPNENGNIGHYQMGDGTVSLMSQPPVGSTICWMIYERFGEKWFLEEVFDNLLVWNRWWLTNRLNGDYLTWGGWKGANAQIAAWESGLDNSPMYDNIDMLETENASILQLADVGLQSLYVADCRSLAKMANALGRKKDHRELEARARRFKSLTQSLWNEEKSLYQNKLLDHDSWSDEKSPTLFYPLVAEIANPDQAEKLIQDHYLNQQEFYSEYLLPSISFDNEKYDNIYWRGAIWPPMNFLVYLGLKNYRPDLAEDLAEKSYRLFMDAWQKHGAVFENINSKEGVKAVSDQKMADVFYHWGALMGIMKFMEEGYYESQSVSE